MLYQNIYLQKLINFTESSKYQSWYCQIITRAIKRASTRKEALNLFNYVEVHHILPRSFKMGGDNSKLNYAYLTAREHFICHRLLVKITTNQYKQAMLQACWLMCHIHLKNKEYKITSRVYDDLKSSGPWNKGIKGLKGRPITDKEKEYLRSLHKGKPRSIHDKQKMKEGWKNLKENGYTPWNKGIKTNKPSATAIKCIFIHKTGIKYEYESMRQGCIALDLPTCKISDVKNGKLSHYKGWKIQTTKKAKNE